MSKNRFFPKMEGVTLIPRREPGGFRPDIDLRCFRPRLQPQEWVWHLVLLGAPGVGKATQAELLSGRLGCCPLPVGKISVADAIVPSLLSERLRCLLCSGGFLLNGFPGTVMQAEALEVALRNEGLALTAVFNYYLPPGQIAERIAGRRVCSQCQADFHLQSRPPRVEIVCDHCGGRLVQRPDDRPEEAAARMKAYEQNAWPLIEFYQKRGLLINVDADGSPEEVYRRTRLLALEKFEGI